MNLKLPVLLFLTAAVISTARAEDALELHNDPHRNEMGFFDMHLCNWPDRNRFFKILFSTEKFADVASMQVLTPEGETLAELNKNKFMRLKRKNKPEKRVYLLDVDVPDNATTGWYRINVKDTQGHEYQASDYMIMSRLERATGMSPSENSGPAKLPVTLKWDPVPGANWYKVYVRDVWDDKLVFRTKLIHEPLVEIPEGKLEAGGDYYWTIHSRDTNEHILLGDFQMGSMSEKVFFSIAE